MSTKEGRFGLILAVVCLAGFMGSLDVSAVLIALPSIADHFNVPTSTATWIIMSYGLVMASFMLIFGKLGDRFGFRRIILIGFAIFTVSSMLCGLAVGIVDLIIYRLAQGIGAAMLAALGPAIVSTYFPPARRGVALGAVTTFASLGLAVGPVVGGLLIHNLDWRWIFLINVPIGLIGLALAFMVVPQVAVDRKKTFDLTGAALVFLALLSIIFCLNMGEELEWDDPVIWASGIAGLALLVLFYRHLKRAKDPLLDIKLMSNRSTKWGNWSSMVILAAASGAFVLLPFYFQHVKGWDVQTIGFTMLVPSLAMVFAGPVAGYLSDRLGCRLICAVACLITGAGFLLLSLFNGDTSLLFIITGLIVLGFSIDMFLAPNHSLIMGHTSEKDLGTSSALMMTMQDTGEVMGVVIFETVFSQFVISGISDELELVPVENMLPGFQAAFAVGIAMGLVALLMTLRTRNAPAMHEEGSDQAVVDEAVGTQLIG